MSVRRIGLISDTHGLVRPRVAELLAGVEVILHAGDVGGGEVLEALQRIAPVIAVRGNVDGGWDPRLLAGRVHAVAGIDIRLTHGDEVGSPTPEKLLARYPEAVIVFGHSHRAAFARRGSRLAVNPGAAGPRRFHLVPSVGVLAIGAGGIDVEIREL